MPTYEYQCDACQRVFEVKQRITEAPLDRCDSCGGPVRRLLSPAPFILKGEGWYVTDYPSESRKKALASEKKGGSDTASAPPADKSSTPASSSTTTGASAPATTSSSS